MPSAGPRYLALFQKRIDGDDALLELARLRFQEAGLGTEFYAGTPDELHHLLQYRPWPDAPVVVHLPRELDLFNEEHRRQIVHFAASCEANVYGFVIHDTAELKTRFSEYIATLQEVNSALQSLTIAPYLFVEYAAGLEPGLFCELFKNLQDLEHISACIDIGHIGIWQARYLYRKKYPGIDLCGLAPTNPALPELIMDVVDAVHGALPTVLEVIRRLGSHGRPLHFHLHDAHPLSTFSPFGISDHLSFFAEIPIPFAYKGKNMLHPMFGPAGLAKIVTALREVIDPGLVSFTLEIHPVPGRLPLGSASSLFTHWQDKTNAEQMNFWLSVLLENYRLLLKTSNN